jgi:hypothetical protein
MDLKKPRLPLQIVGNAGLFYVCHKLSALGWNAMPTSRNARGVDVMCFSMDGQRKFLIQVKSLSKRNPLMLGSDLGKLMGDYWIIVVNATGEKPTCYILTPRQVKNLADPGRMGGKAQHWLQAKDFALSKFCERWDLIGAGSDSTGKRTGHARGKAQDARGEISPEHSGRLPPRGRSRHRHSQG